jgi:hypothetical protein
MAQAGASAEFHAVAATRSEVWAAGSTDPSYRRTRPLVERWDGTRWQVSLRATDSRGLLLGVSESAPDNVWAVGGVFPQHDRSPSALHLLPLVERWDGRAWHRVAVPWAKPGVKLDKVVALSPTDVWVASTGFYGRITAILVEHWDGTSWTSVRAPFGPRAPIAGFTATTGGIAWAVGGYTHNGYTRTLAARWDGTRWAITPTPNPSTAATLTGVSATSPTDAWAIGLTGQEDSGFFMHWNGVRWTLQRAAGQFTAQTVDDGLAISEAPDGSAFAFGHAQGPQGTTIMRWQPPCWEPTPSPDAGASAPSHQACSLPSGGSPAPVVNPNAPAQRRETVAGAEATLTKILLWAQHDAYDASHHKRFIYTSFNGGGGSIVQPPPLSKMGFAMLESLRQMHLGHLPKALAQLREATALLNAHLASHPSDVPKAPPAWAVSWLVPRLSRADRQIAQAATLAPGARKPQVRSWATKAVNWLVEDGIVNSEFFTQPGLPQFRPAWLSPGARWSEINLRYHDILRHPDDPAVIQADLAQIRTQLAGATVPV